MTIWYCGGASALLMLVVSTFCWKKRLRLCYAVCLASGGLAFPVAAFYRLVESLPPWVVCSTLRGPDGQTYTFMASSFLQARTIALGRVASDGLLYKNFDILGDTNGDSYGGHVLVVRPTDKVRTTYGQLHLTDNEMLLGLRYENHCHFAYDFSARMFIGDDTIESLSPFLLVEEHSRLYEKDVETLLERQDAPTVGLPSRQVLLDATRHSNPEVRRLAEQLLARLASE